MVKFVIGMFLGLAATVGVKAAEKAVEKKQAEKTAVYDTDLNLLVETERLRESMGIAAGEKAL